MTPDRWKQVETLFHAALEKPPEERSRFLDDACGDDSSLRKEVETLLQRDGGEDALDGPASVIPGTKLGQYEVLSLLGRGGMGEVWRARDTVLGRDVAVKTLPEGFARDPERLSRFRREARLLASLNHPNVAVIHGLEESGETRYLVLELVAGQTLDAWLETEAPPVESALQIGMQIAEALEAAHARGVIHRDLKPSNIKVTPEGQVKVLDFGLAKAVSPGDADLSQPATRSDVMTQKGQILGTPAYMSPEQVRGEDVGPQADIWAFGCVLFELLTRHTAFEGETASDLIAGILRADPNWSLLPKNLDPRVSMLLKRCLRKNLRTRYHAIADARVSLQEAQQEALEEGPAGRVSAETGSPVGSKVWRAMSGGLALVAIALALTMWGSAPADPPLRPLHQYPVSLGPAGFPPSGPMPAFSPDETELVFVSADPEGTSKLSRYVLADGRTIELEGTEGAQAPFYSPDGAWIGFFRDGGLWRIPAEGGDTTRLDSAPDQSLTGASWAQDGILVSGGIGANAGLLLVSLSGGETQRLTERRDAGDTYTHRFPQVLPGGEYVLFTAHGDIGEYDQARIEVASMDGDHERTILIQGGSFGRYLPSGHLVYVNGGTLYAVPFDPARPEAVDEAQAAPLRFNVEYDPGTGFATMAFGPLTGTGVFRKGGGGEVETLTDLLYLYEDGRTQSLPNVPVRDVYSWVSFSPGGDRLGVRRRGGLWLYDLSDQTFAPAGPGSRYAWREAGQIVYTTTDGVFILSVDTGKTTQIEEAEPVESSPPDESLGLFVDASSNYLVGGRNDSVWYAPFGSREETATAGPLELFRESVGALFPAISPDETFVAYWASSGIEVGGFPRGGDWIVAEGGRIPRWSRYRDQLFFLTDVPGGVRIGVVDYTIEGGVFNAGIPRPWGEEVVLAEPGAGNVVFPYSPDPAGDRFAVLLSVPPQTTSGPTEMTFVENFVDEVRRVTEARTSGSP